MWDAEAHLCVVALLLKSGATDLLLEVVNGIVDRNAALERCSLEITSSAWLIYKLATVN